MNNKSKLCFHDKDLCGNLLPLFYEAYVIVYTADLTRVHARARVCVFACARFTLDYYYYIGIAEEGEG